MLRRRAVRVDRKPPLSARVLFVRSAAFSTTPALARFVGVMRGIVPAERIEALCWNTGAGSASGYAPDPRVRVAHYERRVNARWRTAPLRVLGWWGRLAATLLTRRYALVQASDVIALPVCLLGKLGGAAVVADVRDPIATLAGAHWRSKARLLGVLERVLLRLVDTVIVVDESRKAFVPASRVRAGDVIVIRNLPERDGLPEVIEIEPPADRIVLNFSGHLSGHRGAGMLLDAVVRAAGRLDLEVVGDTSDPSLQARLAAAAVRWTGRVGHDEALRRMRGAHLVALLYDPAVEANRHAAPNKFYEAAMLGRPVLTCDGTPMARWVREHDCGYVVPYGDVDALLAVVDGIRADPADWRRRGHRARALYEREYRWEGEARRLAGAYRRLLGARENI